MPRIRPLARDDAPSETHPIYDQDLKRYATVLNTTGVLAHRPEVLHAARQLGQSVGKNGTLEPALRGLICLRVATIVGCLF